MAATARRAMLAVLAATLLAARPRAAAQPGAVGMPAAPFKLVGADGRNHELSELVRQHRALVINFWATWCGPCIVELPEFDAVYRKLRNRGLGMVGINVGEKADKAVPFAKQLALGFPMLMDPDGVAREGYAVFSGLPVTVVVDRKGLVRHRVAAPLSGEALRALVEPLLREGAP